jgi:cytochrome c oxidase subunit 1
VRGISRLALAHFAVAFGLFLPSVLLGAWQMLMRSTLSAPLDDPGLYYLSVTLHGTVMAYVLTTFFVMGFGYAVATSTMGRSLRGLSFAWAGFGICGVGTLIAAATIVSGRASVLYTFYPPLLASRWYYAGVFLLVGGSMTWVVLMIVNMLAWKREHRGQPVPLAMFAVTATAYLWAWSASGVAAELIGVVAPAAFGITTRMDAGLARTLFSVTLHSIVYFWLMPAYIAFYTLLPAAAGGRLFSDRMARLVFIMFLVFSLPVGMHHLFADPEHGEGFKFLQGFFTFFVVLPTLMTVFSICASLEIAGRLRGGRGWLGWIAVLPWCEPMVLATGLSLLMLGLGGLGGLINMSYAMNSMIHNTSWVTAHFHLIFGGAVVIMYFAIAYELWPVLTGRALRSPRLARWQLWSWFAGMLIVTIPWHIAGLLGQPRRMALFDYRMPQVARWAALDDISVVGGVLLLVSALLLAVILLRSLVGVRTESSLHFSLALHPPTRIAPALNGFALWNGIVLALMIAAYGYPIGQFLWVLKPHSAPAYPVSRPSLPPDFPARDPHQ